MTGGMPREGAFTIVSLNVSEATGTRKRPVPRVILEPGRGVAGDAHAGSLENRQVSFLAVEEIEAASATLCRGYGGTGGAAGPGGAIAALKPGDFAENVTTRGLELHLLPVGTLIEVGEALLEVSKIGKECHAACEIRTLVGDCVMPRKGIFARVLRGGEIANEDICHYRIR